MFNKANLNLKILGHGVPDADLPLATGRHELTSDEEERVDVNSHVEDADLGAGVGARVLDAPEANEVAVGNGDELLFRLVVCAQNFGIEGDSLYVALRPRGREDEAPASRFHGLETADDASVGDRDPIVMPLKDVYLQKLEKLKS